MDSSAEATEESQGQGPTVERAEFAERMQTGSSVPITALLELLEVVKKPVSCAFAFYPAM